MADELEKLREKIAKEPNSKLFVSLADMYRKAGQIEEAIQVLQQGIERQPNYTSARVALAKIYLEKDMKQDAKEEFEKVVKAIPDNLYSQKKLAELYSEAGNREGAIKALRAVIKLNPMDEEAQVLLARIEKEAQAPQPKATLPEKETVIEESPKTEELGVKETPSAPEEAPLDEKETVGELSFAREPSDVTEGDDWLKGTFDLTDDTDSAEEKKDIAVAEENAKKQNVADTVAEEVVSAPGATEADFILSPAENPGQPEILEADEIVEKAVPEEIEAVAVSEPEKAPPEDEGLYAVAEMPTDFGPEQLPSDTTKKAPEPGSLEKADALVKKGEYAGAFSILSNMLSSAPGDKIVKGRFEELRMLIKIMKKEKEVRAGRLNSFLGAVRKRRDEFFRNA